MEDTILTYGVDPYFPKLFVGKTLSINTFELFKTFIYNFEYYPYKFESKIFSELKKFIETEFFKIINSSIIDIITSAPEDSEEVNVEDFLNPRKAKYFFRDDINLKGGDKIFISIKINNSKKENYRLGYYFNKNKELQIKFIDLRRMNIYDGSCYSKLLIKEIIKTILSPIPIKNKYHGYKMWKFPKELYFNG